MSYGLGIAATIVAGLIVYFFFFRRGSIFVVLSSEGVQEHRGISVAAKRRFDRLGPEILPPGDLLRIEGVKTDGGNIRWILPKDSERSYLQQLRNVLTNETVFQ